MMSTRDTVKRDSFKSALSKSTVYMNTAASSGKKSAYFQTGNRLSEAIFSCTKTDESTQIKTEEHVSEKLLKGSPIKD